MEKRIKDRYNDDILHTMMQRYAIQPEQIQLLDGFESFMYAFERDGEAYILRVGHSLRRSIPLIQGEVDWINYLAAGGASVSRAILSENRNLVEIVDDGQGGHFLGTAFVKAQGAPPGRAVWGAPLFEEYGRLIGRMHALAKNYQLPDPAWKRPEWDAPGMLDMEDWLPASEGPVLKKYYTLKTYLDTLPKDGDTYGLIHQDAHGGNFFVDDAGRITLFDFDDCAYSWFMNDIAIVLFYAAVNTDDPSAFTEHFMTHFLKGYKSKNHLNPAWLKEIPHFLKLREIDLYAIIHRSF
ncbi:MAG: phosphotransferase, partial [Chloroflexi bacterium]|nr:phosphotransferase [Chloroflexota bacterium]